LGFTRQRRYTNETALVAPARVYFQQWRTWLQRWRVELSTQDPLLVPIHLKAEVQNLQHAFLLSRLSEEVAAIDPRLLMRAIDRPGTSDWRTVTPALPSAEDLPIQIRYYRELNQHVQQLADNQAMVRTTIADPLTYRLLLNKRLLHCFLKADRQAFNTALAACEQAVRTHYQFGEEVFFPVALLAAGGERAQARAFIKRMMNRYPDDYLPEWQRFFRQLAEGSEAPLPEGKAVYRIQRDHMRAVIAELFGRSDVARQWYQQSVSDTSVSDASVSDHWQDFIRWRLQQP
ncbi:MAG: hypothetical protein ACOCXA_02990, partial [Planctomycetota bacterium]